MSIPFLLFPNDSIFINDYYAKRIIAFVSFPSILFIILISIIKFSKKVRYKINIYLFGASFFLILQLINSTFNYTLFSMNGITDTFVFIIPIISFFIFKIIPIDYNTYIMNSCLKLSIIFTLFKIKLQFSYLGLLAGFNLLHEKRGFLLKILIVPFSLLIIYQNLLGKSAILLLIIFSILNFYINHKSHSIKLSSFLIIPLILLIMLSVIKLKPLNDFFTQSVAIRKTAVFIQQLDLEQMDFDVSTGQRVLEAVIIVNNFKDSGILKKILGHGLGSTIDLSSTIDSAIKSSHNDLKSVRIIHLGFFYVLHKFGILGLLLYYSLFTFLLVKSMKIIRCFRIMDEKLYKFKKWILLMAYYCIAIIIDGQITAGHLFANYFFWFCSVNIIFFNMKKDKDVEDGKYTRFI